MLGVDMLPSSCVYVLFDFDILFGISFVTLEYLLLYG